MSEPVIPGADSDAVAVDPRPENPSPERGTAARALGLLREYAESLIITALIFLFVTTFVFQAYKIPTGSMEDNLLIGDHLIVNKFLLGRNDPLPQAMLPARSVRRGDVIVFRYPNDPTVAYVKRVVGLPGEEIEVLGRTVYVNGQALDEPYIDEANNGWDESNGGPRRVPDDAYFVLGDNRDNSQDSRYWGFVPRDLITGRAFLVYWSFVTERDEYQKTSMGDKARQILDVFLHFFSKTRWDRFFLVVR